MEEKKYNFGEKKEEYINGIKLPVELITPKYREAKKKAIELLENAKYKDVLEESDFWILVNTYANKTKAMYSGLIISHDGCLKINDKLEEKLKFKPSCMTLDKNGYGDSLVYTYCCEEQGLYEVGEISARNCKNDYPYAMALKRCFDRVVLKNSKIAYSGIYSDSEADSFTKNNDEVKEEPKKELKASPKQIEILNGIYKGEKLAKLLEANGIEKLEDMSMAKADELIKIIMEKKESVKNE